MHLHPATLPCLQTLEICATVGLALRVVFAVVHKFLWNGTHRDTVQSQEEFETTRDAHTKDNEVVGRIAVRVSIPQLWHGACSILRAR